MIYPMAIVHDSMRSLQYDVIDRQKARKEKRNDRNHEKYGSYFFEKIMKAVKAKNL